MLSLDVLPPDILLQISALLSLHDIVSLSMVSKVFYALSQEASYWLDPLRTTRISKPLACPSADELATHTTESLKWLALHSIRLARNWSAPSPQIVGDVRTFTCGVHNSILYCLPGTHAIVLHSLAQGTAICCDVDTGLSSPPVFVGRIIGMSSPLEEPGSWTVAAMFGDAD
ncbi:hypothetical protein DFH09DRAFT_1359065 [Mycena vulgaris]|nr:hypothetical protein DFH09DRAFT_1359065 [Mycena vulgaris]